MVLCKTVSDPVVSDPREDGSMKQLFCLALAACLLLCACAVPNDDGTSQPTQTESMAPPTSEETQYTEFTEVTEETQLTEPPTEPPTEPTTEPTTVPTTIPETEPETVPATEPAPQEPAEADSSQLVIVGIVCALIGAGLSAVICTFLFKKKKAFWV